MTAGGSAISERIFTDVVAGLPELHREALRLRHVEGWRLERIAAELGIAPVGVAQLLLEAAGRLQSHLDDTIKRNRP